MRRIATVVASLLALAVAGGLLHYGLGDDTPNPYAGTHLTFAVTSIPVGVWVARRRPDHPVGWMLLLGVGATSTWLFLAQPLLVRGTAAGAPEPLLRVVAVSAAATWVVTDGALFIGAPSVVPQGWPAGARRVVLGIGVIATATLALTQVIAFSDGQLDGPGLTGGTFRDVAAALGDRAATLQWMASVAAIAGLGIAAVRGGHVALRRQRWFLVGAACLAVPALAASAPAVFHGFEAHGWLFDRAQQIAGALLPLTLLIAVLADRMLDITAVAQRVAQYVVLTIAAALAYVAVVAILAVIVGPRTGFGPIVATGVVALLFQPLRAWSQRWVDRRIYGQEPYEMLASLGRKLADVPGTQEALWALVQSIAEGLRIPYVAIELDVEGAPEPVTVAAWGVGPVTGEAFPLTFAGEVIGRLLVGQHTPGERLGGHVSSLLTDLARQAGVVAHDMRLAVDLRRSRREVVVAREEERRRLRGDLHDGLGPTLASVSLGLDAAVARMEDPELCALLRDLNADLRDAIQDIRRVVNDLRPPALDDLGLVRAIAAFIEAGARADGGGVRIELDQPDLPPLPAAVEVAAYRIVLEALTNVRRHAGAKDCHVAIAFDDRDLRLEVRDDGVGPAARPAGVGVVSMRQRAEALGGSFSLEPGSPSGTLVTAVLPVRQPALVPVPAL